MRIVSQHKHIEINCIETSNANNIYYIDQNERTMQPPSINSRSKPKRFTEADDEFISMISQIFSTLSPMPFPSSALFFFSLIQFKCVFYV